jgi:hypothetical protein
MLSLHQPETNPGCPTSPISCAVCSVPQTSCSFPYRKAHTQSCPEQRAGNSGYLARFSREVGYREPQLRRSQRLDTKGRYSGHVPHQSLFPILWHQIHQGSHRNHHPLRQADNRPQRHARVTLFGVCSAVESVASRGGILIRLFELLPKELLRPEGLLKCLQFHETFLATCEPPC